MIKYFHKTIKLIPWYLCHAFFNIEGLDANRMLFCVIFATQNSCGIEQKSVYMSQDTLFFNIYPLFSISLEILYNISSTMPFRGNSSLKLA